MISMMIGVIENTDDQAFMCHLYEEYEQLMFWAAAKYLNNIEDRKDAVQDAIVALIRNLELRLFDDLDSIPAGTSVDMIEDSLLQMAMKHTIFDIWSKLSTQDKILLESKYILGYNDSEIGEILGCKASSVRMYLTRARRKAMGLISEVK